MMNNRHITGYQAINCRKCKGVKQRKFMCAQFEAGSSQGGVGDDRSMSGPGWDIKEDSEAVYVKFELPGMGKDDIRVTLKQHSLVIKGGPEGELGFSGGMEIPPNKCDLDSIRAHMNNGILKVIVPKAKDGNRCGENETGDHVKHITIE